ncbi:hypothetical protein FAI40_09975 [Acetobacteraceae bacterium]|nr:hypothetical protein FAI40_09975 [Acetobacteraceae bacterium]
MLKILHQRSTYLGLGLILGAVSGVYCNLIDEGTATMLIIMGIGGLIPENSPLAHKILEIVAPLLVHQIKQKALLKQPPRNNTKSPF